MDRDIFIYKKLSHMIMETEKSQNQELANWKPRRDDVVPIWRLSDQNEFMFQVRSKGSKKLISQLEESLAEGTTF